MENVREHVKHAHTIDSLITELTRLRETEDGNTPVIADLADSPHEYSPVGSERGVYVAMYYAECSWAGDRFMTPEERASEPNPDDYEEAPGGSVRAVFISPTN